MPRTVHSMLALALLHTLAGSVRAFPEPAQTFTHGSQVERLAVSPNGKVLASGGGGENAKVCLWDLGTSKRIGELTGHRAGITGLAFTPDSKQLITSSWDGQVILWDLSTANVVRRFEGHAGDVTGLALSPDGRTLATGGMDGTIRLWKLATGKERRCLGPLPRSDNKLGVVLAVAFSADGALLAAHQQEGAAQRTTYFLFDAATGKSVGRLGDLPYDFDKQLPGAQRGQGRTPIRFELALRGIQLPAFNSTLLGSIEGFSPNGQAAVYLDCRRVTLVETVTNQDCFEHRHGDQITAVAFAPDGRHLVWADGDSGVVHLWRLAELLGVAETPAKQNARGLSQCWIDLAGDAGRAYRAGCVLAAAPADAVPFLRAKLLDSEAGVDPERVKRLIADLDAPAFAARQKAADELATLGIPALRAVKAVLAGKPGLELARRAERLEKVLEEQLQGEVLRRLRAVQTLERIGTPTAREVLERLARGGLAFEQTCATCALQRLKAAAERSKP